MVGWLVQEQLEKCWLQIVTTTMFGQEHTDQWHRLH